MAENSSIEWCHHTFNTHWGCHEVSPGCTNCYAKPLAHRFGTGWGIDAPRREFGDHHWNEPLRWDRKAAKAGERHRVFCNSMSDLFDKNAPDGVRERLFALIKATPNLDWLLLTKRIGNVYKGMLPLDFNAVNYPNVWLGISVVNQGEADRDIPKLLGINAAVRWLSMEPLLGPVDIGRYLDPVGIHCMDVCPDSRFVDQNSVETYSRNGENIPLCQHCGESASWTGNDKGLDWVIVGGESGASARPMHPDWARRLRDQCAEAGVPFLFKQWGEWTPHQARAGGDEGGDLRRGHVRYLQGDGREPDGHFRRGDAAVARVGKKAAGRLLDGVQHDGYPEGTQ